ncbi:MAG TPA: hypothetical protein VHB01_03880 [Nitrosospira sp.]|nr:hypothetical protein [Nitrosospira sp.]
MPLAALAPIAGVVGAVAAVGGTAFSVLNSISTASKQKKALQQAQNAQAEQQRIQQAQANAAAQRERLQQQREARIRRANVINSTVNTGAGLGGTSGLSGAESSIQSQFGQNIGIINQTQSFASQISAANQREQDAASTLRRAESSGAAWQSIFSSTSHLGSIGANLFGNGKWSGGKKAGWQFAGGGNLPNFFDDTF